MSNSIPQDLSERLSDLYIRMQTAYDKVAEELQFSCEGCPDNCCDSYFLHHTYLEWAYLWEGLQELPQQKVNDITERARTYILECEKALAQEQRPVVMCPLNEKGLCILYKHRMMICRMHGVPSVIVRPDGKELDFPGCFRCQEMNEGKDSKDSVVDRTELYRELVLLESEFLGYRRNYLPRVKMTLAQMIIKGPPDLG